MFSVQAAYTGPILLLAGNRQAAKDRAVAQRDDEELGVIYPPWLQDLLAGLLT
jgi:hypothetical protein